MKTTLALISLVLVNLSAQAATNKEFKFVFNSQGSAQIEIKKLAPNKEQAFKMAAKECFNQLTGGRYPGEERGLDIIDICANPKM